MSLIRDALREIQDLQEQVRAAPDSEYGTGYRAALQDAEEIITTIMFEAGLDEDE